jgi:hypothetical protein
LHQIGTNADPNYDPKTQYVPENFFKTNFCKWLINTFLGIFLLMWKADDDVDA